MRTRGRSCGQLAYNVFSIAPYYDSIPIRLLRLFSSIARQRRGTYVLVHQWERNVLRSIELSRNLAGCLNQHCHTKKNLERERKACILHYFFTTCRQCNKYSNRTQRMLHRGRRFVSYNQPAAGTLKGNSSKQARIRVRAGCLLGKKAFCQA